MSILRIPRVALALPLGLALTAQAQTSTSLNHGLVAHYQANGDVLDVSGLGHHGINDGVEYVADRFGSPRHAWGFPTKDIVRSVRINEVLIQSGQDEFTATAWFRLSDGTVFAFASTILNTSPHAAFFMGFDWAYSPMPIYDIGTGASAGWEKVIQGGSTVPWDHAAWHQLSFVRDGDACRLFFDSVLVQETTAVSRFITDASLFIGTSSHAADPRYGFTGALEPV